VIPPKVYAKVKALFAATSTSPLPPPIGEGEMKTVYDIPHTKYVVSRLKVSPPVDPNTPHFRTNADVIQKLQQNHLLARSAKLDALTEISEKCDLFDVKGWAASCGQVLFFRPSREISEQYQTQTNQLATFADKMMTGHGVLSMNLHIGGVGTLDGETIAVDSDGFFDVSKPSAKLKAMGRANGRSVSTDEFEWDTLLKLFRTLPVEEVRTYISTMNPALQTATMQNAFQTYITAAANATAPNDIKLRLFVAHYVLDSHLCGGLLTLPQLHVYKNASPDMREAADTFLTVIYGKAVYNAENAQYTFWANRVSNACSANFTLLWKTTLAHLIGKAVGIIVVVGAGVAITKAARSAKQKTK
jgi:hypothetical protein